MHHISFDFCSYITAPGIPLPSAAQLITMTNVDIIVDADHDSFFSLAPARPSFLVIVPANYGSDLNHQLFLLSLFGFRLQVRILFVSIYHSRLLTDRTGCLPSSNFVSSSFTPTLFCRFCLLFPSCSLASHEVS